MDTESIELLRVAILEETSNIFPDELQLAQLSDVAQSLETFVRVQLGHQLCTNVTQFLPGAVFSANDDCIRRGNAEYTIRCAPDVVDARQIFIAIQPRLEALPKYKLDKIARRLNSIGKIQSIHLFTPPHSAIDSHMVLALAETVIATSYEWLNQKFRGAVHRDYLHLSDALYAYLKNVFVRGELWKSIWLGGVTDDTGFYLLDGSLVDQAMERISKAAITQGQSTLYLLAEFLRIELPFESMGAGPALTTGETLDYEILHSPYVDAHRLFAEVERQVFQSDTLSCYPIVSAKDGARMLVAWFPVELRSAIEPVLAIHRDALKRIFRRSSQKLRGALRSLQSPYRAFSAQGLSRLGNFVGGVARAFTDT